MAVVGVIKNYLLKAISAKDLEKHFGDLQPVQLASRDVLCDSGEKIEHVYFPENSLVSIVTIMSDGDMVEVGMIGAEGLVGGPTLLGVDTSSHQIVVQGAGQAYRISAKQCRLAFEHCLAFRAAALRHFESFLNLAGQTAACNRLHSIEQRAARWMLMASDRMQHESILMTHEFLSSMLGARRAGVTKTAGDLQRSGLIRYHHGQLTIVDRPGLEVMACECYVSDKTRLKSLKAIAKGSVR
jgi:CRP-like cAMP-binding protein